MTDEDRILNELSEIREGQSAQRELLGRIDERLKSVEQKADAAVEAAESRRLPKSRALARDSGLTISGATLGGALLWLLQHLAGK